MLDNEKIIKKFREFMANEKVDFFIVNATDEYLNEYIDLNINSRYILTGFSGSTGDCIVTSNDIYLFVDGRYHLQADEETDSKLVTVEKSGLDTSPQQALINKINELAQNNETIGLLSKKISYSYFKNILESLKDKNIKIKEYPDDPVLKLADTPNLPRKSDLRHIPVSISGETVKEKLVALDKKFKKLNIDMLLVTKLEEIAFITNLRGKNIPYSSSFQSLSFINNSKCFVFYDCGNIAESIKQKLKNEIDFIDKNLFKNYVNKIEENKKIAFDPLSTNLYTYKILKNINSKLIELSESPIAQMKAVKNSSELSHMQDCFRKTDIVVSRSISWLNQNLEKGIKITEKEFSDRVKELFLEDGAYGLSFEVLAASGQNTAIIHYTNPSSDKYLEKGDLVLLDCGGYYEGGYATDITRTFLAGGSRAKADEKTKKIYTKVLKSFLNGLYYPINEDTTGFDIDKKVRDILTCEIEDNFAFSHSTGHGVGISVHESSPRIGPGDLSKTKLIPGMCFTIEPGLYNNNWGGIRLENTVTLVNENQELKIKPLGKSKFDENLIDFQYLTQQEIAWFKDYQGKAIG